MNLCDSNTIKRILKDNKIWAKKQLGQHFLVAEQALIIMAKTAQINADDTVLEIGPGLGVLTQELAKQAKLVLAIEKDRAYVEWLRKYFKSKKNVKIICQDILQYNLDDLSQSPEPQKDVRFFRGTQASGKRLRPTFYDSGDYKVVSNLPYQITSPVIRKFLTAENKPAEMVLMMQKEVAQRIIAKAGNSDRGFLTVLVEFFAKAEIIDYVPSEAFWPQPDVESAIVGIRSKEQGVRSKIRRGEEKGFFRLVKMGFSQKRRQIHNPLKSGLHINKEETQKLLKNCNINLTNRAEDLTLTDWMRLFEKIKKLT